MEYRNFTHLIPNFKHLAQISQQVSKKQLIKFLRDVSFCRKPQGYHQILIKNGQRTIKPTHFFQS